jgi:thromboxane-A synthase/cytochrome P450 family 3 subfamily A
MLFKQQVDHCNSLAPWLNNHPDDASLFLYDAGPPYRPVFGNLPEFRDIGSHEYFAQCHQRYGPIFKVWFGHRPWIVVCDPDLGK